MYIRGVGDQITGHLIMLFLSKHTVKPTEGIMLINCSVESEHARARARGRYKG